MIGDTPPPLPLLRIVAGLALAARTILHAIEDIEKSHNLSPESEVVNDRHQVA